MVSFWSCNPLLATCQSHCYRDGLEVRLQCKSPGLRLHIHGDLQTWGSPFFNGWVWSLGPVLASLLLCQTSAGWYGGKQTSPWAGRALGGCPYPSSCTEWLQSKVHPNHPRHTCRTLNPWVRNVPFITSMTFLRLGTSKEHCRLHLKMFSLARARTTSFFSHVGRKRSKSSGISGMKSVRDTNQIPWVLMEAAKVSKLLF